MKTLFKIIKTLAIIAICVWLFKLLIIYSFEFLNLIFVITG